MAIQLLLCRCTTKDKLLYLHGVLSNSEEFHLYGSAFEEQNHLHNKPPERKKGKENLTLFFWVGKKKNDHETVQCS